MELFTNKIKLVTFQSLKLSNKIKPVSTDKTHKGCLTSSSDSEYTIQTQWIGNPIRKALGDAPRSICRGITSRGIFLELSNNWIAFLSNEQIHGPLTLNFLSNDHDSFSVLKPGDIGTINNYNIHFEHHNFKLDFAKAKVWSSKYNKNSPIVSNKMAMRNFRIVTFLDKMQNQEEHQNEFIDFAHSLYISDSFPLNSAPNNQLSRIFYALIKVNPSTPMDAINHLAGRGNGLTPAGDDFLAGMLYLFALSDQWVHPEDMTFRDIVLEVIRKRSTMISACLAECAAMCEVDERIATTADYLLNGTYSEETAIKAVKDWGSSSGLDSISGFITALKIIEFRNENLNP